MARSVPVGTLTRGTTHPNRLRRFDRWIVHQLNVRLRSRSEPIVVDLGFGANPVTTLELAHRLRSVTPAVRVIGIEIDPLRVAAARSLACPGVEFRLGGFEVPLPDADDLATDDRLVLIRACNVLRQYQPADVRPAWALMCSRLADDGILVDGTCDELGRRCAWITVSRNGPASLTLSMDLSRLERPIQVAARLPKSLIQHNVPGEAVHAYLCALDEAWARHAPLATFGPRQRFIATAKTMSSSGWPLLDRPPRWRLGEITVAWDAVRP